MKRLLITLLLLAPCTKASGQAPPIATTTTMNLPASISQGEVGLFDAITVPSADGLGARGMVQLSFSNFGTFTHTLVNGSTQYTLYSLPVGTYQVQASFAAQGPYAASTSAAQTLTVVPDLRIPTWISFDPDPDIIQGDHHYLATVRVVADDNSVLTGTVQLSFSGFGTFTHTLVPEVQSTINGQLNYSSTNYTLYSLPVGTYQVQASFPAQGVYGPSKSWVHTLTVHPRQ